MSYNSMSFIAVNVYNLINSQIEICLPNTLVTLFVNLRK